MNKYNKYVSILMVILLAMAIYSVCHSAGRYAKYNVVGYKYYTVQAGDTVSNIADKHKPAWITANNYTVLVQVANKINEHIEPGEQILIPLLEGK